MKTVKSAVAHHSDLTDFIPVGIFFVTLLAFLPALRNGFVWDDYENLLQNTAFRGLGWSQLKWMFSTFHMGLYQPISWFSYGLDFELWGLDPKGYHFSNAVIHAANAVLVYICSLKLYEEAVGKTPATFTRTERLAALFSALFFSLHPLRVESVAWATERRDVLSGLFALLAISLHIDACRGANSRARMLSITSYGLSLLSKPAAVGLPLWLLLIDFYPLRRLVFTKESEGSWRRILIEKVPYFVLALAISALAPMAMSRNGSLLQLQTIDTGQRLLMVMFSGYFYIFKTLIPFGLLPLYLRPAHVDPSGQFLFAAIVVPLTTVIAAWSAKRTPAFTVAWFCYILLLLPVSGLIPNGPQITADRYSYLSCIPWAVLLGGLILMYLRSRGPQASLIPAAVVVGIGLASLLILTERQFHVWRDEASLWGYLAEEQPGNYFAQYNLARALQSTGEISGAKLHYELAAKIDPAKKDIYANLGILLASNGEQDSALNAFRAAQRLAPSDPTVLNGLGNVLSAQGKISEAVVYYEAAFKNGPNDMGVAQNAAEAWTRIGMDAVQHGQYSAASRAFRSALTYGPKNFKIMYNLATSLALQGQDVEAASWYLRVCEIDSSNTDARINLARIYRRLGRVTEAAQQIRIAQQLGALPLPK
jgi:Flp pilus assembly protein TadD/uncharacterized membrane protein YecN with MAPEG domain